MATPVQTHPIMIQGTASSSGKSLVTAALCRILHQDGIRVAPFKAQNMSNNSFVTHDGYEMGRAQVVQAIAAGLRPDVCMNPVLIKPSSDTGAQVVVHGKPKFFMDASSWHETREQLRIAIQQSYTQLAAAYPVIVLEGAGSPAEINLKENDVVNMGMAKMANAPVLIVGDIDKGGVFASLVGTMHLLDEDERARVKGFIINKFRGDESLLTPGLKKLEAITGVPVIGVIPWIHHAIDDEDGQAEWLDYNDTGRAAIDICIIRLPHISNFTDFIPLESAPGVKVRWCDNAVAVGTPDLLIIPGTKATIADLSVLRRSGLADAITAFAAKGGYVLGVCGGFQMLGQKLADPYHAESAVEQIDGLGLLAVETVFSKEKTTLQVHTLLRSSEVSFFAGNTPLEVDGYEIHMGTSEYAPSAPIFTFSYNKTGDAVTTGITDATGNIAGTYCHGLFDSATVVKSLIDQLRVKKGLPPVAMSLVDRVVSLDADIDRLAKICREHLDMPRIMNIIGIV